MTDTLHYNIAITSIPNIGDINAKKLIAYCGNAEHVFKENTQSLEKIPGIGRIYAQSIIKNKSAALKLADKELKFIEDNNIRPLFFLDKNYPQRLVHCEDGPVLIYSKGNIDFNTEKVVSIVGTRKATAYGKDFCDKIIEELIPHNPLIVSGLAYGIDICAHKAAVQNKLSTIAVLAHGLDRLYPQQHNSVAKKMLENGGLISNYKSGTNPDRENFPKRNRIVAGLSDLTIVIESSKKGGSLITAELANSYNRDVFALPGRLSDSQSEGCNWLIKTNKAALIQSVKDIEYLMGWQKEKLAKNQLQLFTELTGNQKIIADFLFKNSKAGIDDIALNAKISMSETASLLLDLEFNGVVKSFPGKIYRLI